MSQLLLDEIPENARLTVPRVMELTGLCRSKVFARIADGHFAWALAPNPARGPKLLRIVDARSLPQPALKKWEDSRLAGNFLIPFEAHEASQQNSSSLSVANPAQLLLLATSPAAIRQESFIDECISIVKECKNGAYAKYGCSTKTEYVEFVARKTGRSAATIYRLIRRYEAGGVREMLPHKRGPAPTGAGSEVYGKEANSWMRAHVEENFRAGLSKSACHRLLLAEIETRQSLHRAHVYDVPSEFQTKSYLRSLPPINETARQKGAPGLHVAAGYCDRAIDEPAGDTWCIDEWMVDGRVYLDWKMREVIRPFIITIIDQRSEAILGWKLVVNPNSEAVLSLTEECLRKCWKPLRWYSDRGGHFRAKVGKHYKEISAEKMMKKAAGALGRLGILHQGPRVKNPRGNRIERTVHSFYAAKVLETLAGSACGNSPEAAEALGVQARVDRHIQLCKSGDVRLTELLSYKQLRAMIPAWIEAYNGSFSDANGLQGLTREAAFRTFCPAESVRQERAIDETDMAFKFAEHFENRTIREGGVIDLGVKEGEPARYYSPLLTVYAGKRALVKRFRHWRSSSLFNSTMASRTCVSWRIGAPALESAIAKASRGRKRNALASRSTFGPDMLRL